MSRYAPWWDVTVTIYNKYTDPTTRVVSWYKTVISDCFWRELGDKINIANIEIDTNANVCRIPKSDLFIPSGEWVRLEDKSSSFTLKQGDIIVRGECDFDIDEYEKGKRSTDLLTEYHTYGECMEIKKVAIDTMTGMLYPHYRVTGI